MSLCLCPLAFFVGSVSSAVWADSVAQILEPYLCPEDSTAEIVTYQTTMLDDYGNEEPATGYEMQCVDVAGSVTRELGPSYAFYWVGALAAGGLVIAGLLSLLLAAPAGAFISRRFRQSQTNDSQENLR